MFQTHINLLHCRPLHSQSTNIPRTPEQKHIETRRTPEQKHKGITNKSKETRRNNKSEQQIRNPKLETPTRTQISLTQKRRRQRRRSSVMFFFIVFFLGSLGIVFFRGFSFFVAVLRRQIVPQFLIINCSSVLRCQIVGSSSGLFFVVKSLVSSIQLLFKYQNRVLETRFNKSELESIRLKIYVAFSVQLIQPNTCKASL